MSKAPPPSRIVEPGKLAPSEFGRAFTHTAQPFAPAFMRTRDVLRITSLSRATLYRRIAARRFPAPVHLGGRACGWPTAEIQDWIRDPQGYCSPATKDSGAPRACGRPPKIPELKTR